MGSIKELPIAIVRLYQYLVSPIFPSVCRFYPTCSNYTIQAIEKYGALKGIWLGLKRFIKCHPFNPGGYDPLP